MMTKKDYKKIADLLTKHKDIEITFINEMGLESSFPIVSAIIEDFIVMLKGDNPRFNEEKFKKAIYGEENK